MYIYCYTVVCIYTEKGKLQRKQLLIMTMCSHAYNIYIYICMHGSLGLKLYGGTQTPFQENIACG